MRNRRRPWGTGREEEIRSQEVLMRKVTKAWNIQTDWYRRGHGVELQKEEEGTIFKYLQICDV